MDIIVLIKEVPDLDVWIEIDPRTLRPDPNDLIYIANPCDLVSLRLAIMLIQRSGAGSITAMLLGPKRAEKTLRKCLDYGATRAIHLICENIVQLESHQIALFVAETIRRMDLPYDLIFAGHDYSGSGYATGQIGSQVGAYLGLPQVSEVRRINMSPGHEGLIVECTLEFGDRISLKCFPPLLLTIHPDAEQISYPPLEVSLKALDIQVNQLESRDLHLEPSEKGKRISLMGVSAPRSRPKKVFAPESTLSAAERMRRIMTGGLEEKQSDLLQGRPQTLAKHIFDFLVQKRIIKPGFDSE